MVQIVGTYELVSQENYEAYLKAAGYKDDVISVEAQAKRPVVITAVNDKEITFAFDGKNMTFQLNSENDHQSSTGNPVKLVFTKNGDTISFKSYSPDKAFFDERVMKITDSGLTSTMSIKGVSAVLKYKRL